MLARSYGPGGQRAGLAGAEITTDAAIVHRHDLAAQCERLRSRRSTRAALISTEAAV